MKRTNHKYNAQLPQPPRKAETHPYHRDPGWWHCRGHRSLRAAPMLLPTARVHCFKAPGEKTSNWLGLKSNCPRYHHFCWKHLTVEPWVGPPYLQLRHRSWCTWRSHRRHLVTRLLTMQLWSWIDAPLESKTAKPVEFLMVFEFFEKEYAIFQLATPVCNMVQSWSNHGPTVHQKIASNFSDGKNGGIMENCGICG